MSPRYTRDRRNPNISGARRGPSNRPAGRTREQVVAISANRRADVPTPDKMRAFFRVVRKLAGKVGLTIIIHWIVEAI